MAPATCSRCGGVFPDVVGGSGGRFCVDCAAELASGAAPLLRGAKTITVEVSEETYALIAVLGKSYAVGRNGDVETVVRHLVHSAADGVRRPGAWERSWIEQAFGDDWEDHLEQDPETEWYRRPRGGL
jgi:hypothetical protein